MILKLKVKSKKNQSKRLIAWIQREKLTKSDVLQVLGFFQDQIQVSKIRKFHPYYKITSENPAIIISLFSTLQELIPDVYFSEDSTLNLGAVQ